MSASGDPDDPETFASECVKWAFVVLSFLAEVAPFIIGFWLAEYFNASTP